MDNPSRMAVSHRSPIHQQDAAASQARSDHYHRRRRRRRPSLWDVRTSPYIGQPLNPSALPNNTHHPAPNNARLSNTQLRSGDLSNVYIPGPNDVVHAPRPDESGPLAGINVPALLALLRPSSSTTPASPSNKYNLSEVQPQAVADSTGYSKPHIPSSVPHSSVNNNGNPANSNNLSNPNVNANLGSNSSANPYQSRHSGSGNVADDAAMASTRHARRLYVGNLPDDTSEVQIGDFFNRALVKSKGSESGLEPVISVYINMDKRFAFIETRTMREAMAGLSLDGLKFRNVSLRVRRPNDFIAHEARVRPPDGFNPAILGIVSTQVNDGPNKMFIGGIPYGLTEDQVKGLLQSFGELAAFNLIKEATSGLSKGFAFFEYADSSVVEAACKELHGMQVGDKTLTVRRATHSSGGGGGGGGGNMGPGGGAGNAASGHGLLGGSGIGSDIGPGATYASGLARPNGNASIQLAKLSDLIFPSTLVVQLKGIVDVDEVEEDETYYSDLIRDVESEAAKFGKISELHIPRPRHGNAASTSVGSAFIKYTNTEAAESAQICFDGRKFDGRIVKALFADDNVFQTFQV